MSRKFYIGEANQKQAFITTQEGEDVAIVSRTNRGTRQELDDDDWQQLVDRLDAVLRTQF